MILFVIFYSAGGLKITELPINKSKTKEYYICFMLTMIQQHIILDTLKKCNPSLIGIFGSYARNEQTDISDMDILLDSNSKIHLLELIGLEQELTELLGIKVDLVTMNSVSKQLKPYIQQDLIRIF